MIKPEKPTATAATAITAVISSTPQTVNLAAAVAAAAPTTIPSATAKGSIGSLGASALSAEIEEIVKDYKTALKAELRRRNPGNPFLTTSAENCGGHSNDSSTKMLNDTGVGSGAAAKDKLLLKHSVGSLTSAGTSVNNLTNSEAAAQQEQRQQLASKTPKMKSVGIAVMMTGTKKGAPNDESSAAANAEGLTDKDKRDNEVGEATTNDRSGATEEQKQRRRRER